MYGRHYFILIMDQSQLGAVLFYYIGLVYVIVMSDLDSLNLNRMFRLNSYNLFFLMDCLFVF